MPTARKTAKRAAQPAAKSGKASTRKSPSTRTSSGKTAGRAGAAKSRTSAARKSAAKGKASSASKTNLASKKPAAKKSGGTGRGRAAPNALELLTRDHREVQKMFRKAERMEADDPALRDLVEQACDALTLHASVEEELLYPALRDEDEGMIAEANVEHDVAKDLIAQLSGMADGDERYKATFKVLGEYVNHHVEEEEGQIFRLARRAKLDLDAIGDEIRALKEAASGGLPAAGSARTGRKAAAHGMGTERSSGGEDDDAQEPAGEASADRTARGRTDGDAGEDTEQPGRSGRFAQSVSGDETEIDIETPDGRAGGTRRNLH